MLFNVKEVLRKRFFYDEVINECCMHNIGDLVLCIYDLNERLCRHINVFDGVH